MICSRSSASASDTDFEPFAPIRMPALFTKPLTVPYAAAASNMATTSASTPTSASCARACPPLARIFSTSAAAASALDAR